MSTEFKARQPKGIPVGGQFAPDRHSESGVTLNQVRNRELMAERRELLKTSGYIPAATLHAANAPTTTERRGEWWNRNFVAAEYRAAGKGYPQMPDDYTPARTLGHAMSGHRRTHRMNYGNKDIQLRMPSVTSIKRFSKEHMNPTFDVPVSVSIKGGAPVQGWVRVTKTGPDQWETTTLGGPKGDAADQVAEAAAAVLESRRPTAALSRVSDLLEARKQREAARGSELNPIKSSFIDSIGYDEPSSTMATRIGDKLYGHKVTKQFFDAVRSAERPGAVFNKLVRQGQGSGVEQCSKCNRFSATGVSHTCPTGHKPESGIGLDHVERARTRASHVAATASRGVDPVLDRKVAPAAAPVNTAPAPGAQPVPAKKTGLPGRRRRV
ncbi:hypothetical protein [Arthrobacter sp. H14]|uniref:hypothetical protein n=1 Tax=Arthrobacter sp. H14 TaxID=1312959 RepID=UPI00047DD690|nr:hypothetical protein [Arthrobacter sp. H14]